MIKGTHTEGGLSQVDVSKEELKYFTSFSPKHFFLLILFIFPFFNNIYANDDLMKIFYDDIDFYLTNVDRNSMPKFLLNAVQGIISDWKKNDNFHTIRKKVKYFFDKENVNFMARIEIGDSNEGGYRCIWVIDTQSGGHLFETNYIPFSNKIIQKSVDSKLIKWLREKLKKNNYKTIKSNFDNDNILDPSVYFISIYDGNKSYQFLIIEPILEKRSIHFDFLNKYYLDTKRYSNIINNVFYIQEQGTER